MNTEQLLRRLDTDIDQDARKMGRWRQIHRIIATAVTLTLIVLPVATAMKLLGEGAIQTYCLFALTVLAAFDGMFKPAAYSARRRVDAADMTELLWQYRSAVITAGADSARQLAVHDAYRKRYQRLYRERGQYLVDYGLAQRENDKGRKSDNGPPDVSTAATTPITSTTATGTTTGTAAPSAASSGAPAATAGPKPGPSSNGDITSAP